MLRLTVIVYERVQAVDIDFLGLGCKTKIPIEQEIGVKQRKEWLLKLEIEMV